ncbi:hypothetical protein [Actinoplanes sp. NPDC048796]|uniref:PIN-like domain-containing protein n=1 Tax=unclassified Actinoplanes TaxID=2626549 RepID=UPI0033E78B9D
MSLWRAAVARNRWLILTRDRHIRENLREIEAVRTFGARMIPLSGPEARGTFEQLEIIMIPWRSIGRLLDDPGPFIYTATRTSLRAVPLS